MVQIATKRNQRGASRRVSQNKSSGQNNLSLPMNTPVFRPVYKFSRTIERTFDIANDGINPSLGGFVFRLSDLPNSTDFTNLFDMYHITKIDIDWIPEYTELTDAALVSNAVNVRFNSTVDISDANPPLTVDEILQYQAVKSSGITKPHKQSWKPTFLMGGLVPCSCWLPTSNPSERHYAIKYGIPPCGVAMVFRSRVKIYVECANVN
jgi:hypothetical protein